MRKERGENSKRCSCCNLHIFDRISKYASVLKQLITAKGHKRNEILENADNCLIKLLCECAMNVLKGRVSLKKSQLKRLSPHGRTLVKLSRTTGFDRAKTKLDQARKLLQKRGGFLPIILPPLLTLLSGFAGQALGKLIK